MSDYSLKLYIPNTFGQREKKLSDLFHENGLMVLGKINLIEKENKPTAALVTCVPINRYGDDFCYKVEDYNDKSHFLYPESDNLTKIIVWKHIPYEEREAYKASKKHTTTDTTNVSNGCDVKDTRYRDVTRGKR